MHHHSEVPSCWQNQEKSMRVKNYSCQERSTSVQKMKLLTLGEVYSAEFLGKAIGSLRQQDLGCSLCSLTKHNVCTLAGLGTNWLKARATII